MTDTAMTVFDPAKGMPTHVGAFFDDQGSNIADRQTVPSLSPQGKQWTISLEGNKTVLQRRNQDGDVEPVSTLRVVVLDYAKRRGRAYYEGAYDPNQESAPVCWSDDGIAPPVTVEKRQSERCDSCPMAAKGSKVTDGGKAVTACSQHRMLAILPANNLNFEPLRLKIAITSDFDKQSPDAEAQGWYAFSNYTDYLKSRGVQHTAALVTKMKFDHNAAYPKIFFSADRWLTPEELAVVAPVTKDPKVQALLGGTWTPAGPDGVKQVETTAQEPAAAATVAPAPAPAPPPPPPPPPAPAPAPAAAAAPVDDDDGEIIMGLDAPAAKPSQGPAQGPVAQPVAVDASLEALLNEWAD